MLTATQTKQRLLPLLKYLLQKEDLTIIYYNGLCTSKDIQGPKMGHQAGVARVTG